MARPKKPTPPVTTPVVFERVASCSDENGLMSSQPVRVAFDPTTGSFGIDLAPHLVQHHDIDVARNDRVDDLIQYFEQLNEAFSITRLRLQATTPMLLVGLYSEVSNAAKAIRRIEHVAGLGITEIAFNPAAPDAVYLREEGKATSIAIDVAAHGEDWIIVPDKPEVRERLTSMADSIQGAADVLTDLRKARDPVAYLMNLSGPWTPKDESPPAVEPAKVDTPFVSDDEI